MVAETHRSQLSKIKKNIESAVMYFKSNNERYHDFQRMVFNTALTDDDEQTLQAFGKPVIEFNITNAPISRLCGEFSKQEPSITVMAEAGMPVDEELIKVVEGHMRHIFDEAQKHNTQYAVYRDQLSGGFSSFKVWTEYAHSMSFDQVIKFGRVFEPTMCGFDPMAREVDKKDAQWCYELYPMTKDDFKSKYPDINLDDVSFAKDDGAFNWSFKQGDLDVIILARYFTKKKKKKKIVRLADNRVLSMDDYEKFLAEWQAQGFIEQPPAIVGEPRWTDIESVVMYELIETEILDYVDDKKFDDLPLVFVDGDSVIIKRNNEGNMSQFTKPYVYHAKGIQRLTNFSGQVIANDFELMVMHKFKVAKESIPQEKEYWDAYTNIQQASTLVYNAFMDNDPDKPIPAPQEIARVGLPQEVPMIFNTSMQMLQNILGTYDSQLGINDNQLSGIAIVEAATQSNAAAMPYIVNYMVSLTQVANIIVKMIPKYYVTPRTIPVLNKDGTRESKKINQPGGLSFNYDENALQVRVEAGPSFAIQKSKALTQVTAMMQASPIFGEFINEVGLDFILDNMEFKGADVLKERATAWMKKYQQMKEQAQNQPNPEMIKAQMMQQKMQQEQQQMMMENQIKQEQLMIDKMKVDNERLDMMVKAGESKDKLMVGIAKANAEEERARADMHMKSHDMIHSHKMDIATHNKDVAQLHHDMSQRKKDKSKE